MKSNTATAYRQGERVRLKGDYDERYVVQRARDDKGLYVLTDGEESFEAHENNLEPFYSKYRIGDIVRVNTTNPFWPPNGKSGRVVAVREKSYRRFIYYLDIETESQFSNDNCEYREDDLVLVSEKGGIKPMNKTELIDQIAKKAKLSKSDSEKALKALTETIGQTLKKGDKVSLIGFGTFEVAKRAARTGKNPKTGAAIKIPASKAPKFKAGKALKDLVNGKK